MKKTLLSLSFVLVAGIPLAHAQSVCNQGSVPGVCVDQNGMSCPCPGGGSTATPSSGSGNSLGQSLFGGGGTQTSGFVPLTNIPGLTTGEQATPAGLANFLNNLYKYLVGIAAILAVIEIIWGGLEIATKDSVSKNQDGKERIQSALLGLVLVLSPVLVFSIINPSILNLSLNLPPINQTGSSSNFLGSLLGGGSGGNGGSGSTSGSGTTDPTTGCTNVIGTSGILQSATCPDQNTADQWSSTNCANETVDTYATTNSSTGVSTGYVVVCSGTQNYVFINTQGSSYISIINGMQPLASTPTNPSNGSNAMNFASICSSIASGAASGRNIQTCVSNTATFSFSVPCNLTGPNANTTWKCYNQQLSCKSGTLSPYCSSSPSWTPFQ